MKRVVLLISLITSTLLTFAQSGVEVKVEPIEMMIGEQAQVTVTVQAGKDDKVEFPTYQPRQQIVEGVEVIAAQHPSDNILQLTGDYTTSHVGTVLAITHLEATTPFRFNPEIWVHN